MPPFLARNAALLLLAGAALSLPSAAFAADDRPAPAAGGYGLKLVLPLQSAQETRRMPPAAPARETAPPLPPEKLTRDRYVSFQVNVDAQGRNIVGDAANEPSLTADPRHPYRLAIGWRQFDSIQSDFRQAGYAYSQDAGHHWTFAGVIDPGIFRTDPVLDCDLNGDFFYHSLTVAGSEYSVQLYESLDEGMTWGPAVPGYGGDKNWMVVDRTTGMGSGNVYAIWQRFFNCCDDRTFTRSIDGGHSFQTPVHIPSNPTFGTLAVGPDGEVYAAGIEAIDYQNYNQFVVAKSTNAKNPAATPTFTTVNVNLGGSMDFADGPNPVGILGQAQVAVDCSSGPTRGNVYLLCSAITSSGSPLDVMFARSTDGGQTWRPPVRINTDPPNAGSWHWFGTIGVAPNGRIDVVWNDTRETHQVNRSALYYAFSADGGATWSANFPLTQTWDSFVGWPQQDKIGDYYQLVSDNVGANLAYAATFNGEQDVYFMRIGDYDCNGNGIGDSLDLANGTLTDFNHNGIPDQCEGLGDLNCDGQLGFGDINPFVLALSDPAGYAVQYPHCDIRRADINGSGTVDFDDINAFVALLSH